MSQFVYSPFTRGKARRVYVDRPNGARVGYLDLAANPPKRVLTGGSDDELDAALTQMVGASAAEPRAEADEAPELPWDDLAERAPGESIEYLGGYAAEAGVAGEQRTAGVLSTLGWRVLHSIPIGENKDLDHLAIGPAGVFAINTKATSYKVEVRDQLLLVDGYEKAWEESIERDAGLVSDVLSAALRCEVEVFGVVAVWSRGGVVGDEVDWLIPGDELAQALSGDPRRLSDVMVETIYAAARRSDTWEHLAPAHG